MLKLARFVKHLWSFVELFCLNFVMFSLQVFFFFFSWCMVNIFPELNNSEGSFSTAFFLIMEDMETCIFCRRVYWYLRMLTATCKMQKHHN